MAGMMRGVVVLVLTALWLAVLTAVWPEPLLPHPRVQIPDVGVSIHWPGTQRRDLNGNAIDEAVREYRVDPRGTLYERRSGDSAPSRLPAPTL